MARAYFGSNYYESNYYRSYYYGAVVVEAEAAAAQPRRDGGYVRDWPDHHASRSRSRVGVEREFRVSKDILDLVRRAVDENIAGLERRAPALRTSTAPSIQAVPPSDEAVWEAINAAFVAGPAANRVAASERAEYLLALEQRQRQDFEQGRDYAIALDAHLRADEEDALLVLLLHG